MQCMMKCICWQLSKKVSGKRTQKEIVYGSHWILAKSLMAPRFLSPLTKNALHPLWMGAFLCTWGAHWCVCSILCSTNRQGWSSGASKILLKYWILKNHRKILLGTMNPSEGEVWKEWWCVLVCWLPPHSAYCSLLFSSGNNSAIYLVYNCHVDKYTYIYAYTRIHLYIYKNRFYLHFILNKVHIVLCDISTLFPLWIPGKQQKVCPCREDLALFFLGSNSK